MNTFVRSEGMYAGGLIHVFEVVERWIELSVDVVVFAPAFAREAVEKRLPQAEFVTMPSIELASESRVVSFLSRAAMCGWRTISLRRCDALFASSQLLPDVVPLLFGRKSARVAFIAHVLDAPWRRRGPLFRNALASAGEDLGLYVCRFATNAIVTCSQLVAGQLLARGLKAPCYITTNGVEHVRHTGARHSHGAVCVSRLHPVKGVEDLIHAWRIVVDAVPDATLTIIGGGDSAYRLQLEELKRSLRLDAHVTFTGKIEDEVRNALLGSSSIFMFASSEEGFGIAVAEAFGAGLPCVTYDLPIFREVFPAGRLAAEVGDIAGLANHAITLFGDTELREKLSQEGTAMARDFTWERAAFVDGQAIFATLIESLEA